MDYKQKYLKYKQKYMELQRYQLGGRDNCPADEIQVVQPCDQKDEEERKKNYKAQALKLHPDRNSGCEDDAAVKFQELNEKCPNKDKEQQNALVKTEQEDEEQQNALVKTEQEDEEQQNALVKTEQEDKDKLKKDSQDNILAIKKQTKDAKLPGIEILSSDSEKSDIKSSDVSLGGNEIPYKSFPLMNAEEFKKNRHYIPTII